MVRFKKETLGEDPEGHRNGVGTGSLDFGIGGAMEGRDECQVDPEALLPPTTAFGKPGEGARLGTRTSALSSDRTKCEGSTSKRSFHTRCWRWRAHIVGAARMPPPRLLCGELGSCVAHEANSTFYPPSQEQQRLRHTRKMPSAWAPWNSLTSRGQNRTCLLFSSHCPRGI